MRIAPHNLRLVSYPGWRVTILHWLAKALGVLVHIEGLPFGSSRNVKPLTFGGGMMHVGGRAVPYSDNLHRSEGWEVVQ